MAASDVTQKEPFLTGFSKHLYGSAKRSKQRSILLFRKNAFRDSTSSFARLFENILPAAWLAGIDPTRRIRDFPLILVFWAWFAQIIDGNASCSKALSMIQSWRSPQAWPDPKAAPADTARRGCGYPTISLIGSTPGSPVRCAVLPALMISGTD